MKNKSTRRFIGKQFGFLRITNIIHKDGRSFAEFKCDCGNVGFAYLSNIIEGRKTSCGCRQKFLYATHGMNYKHGMSNQPIYNTWNKMVNRCYKKDERSYPFYGGSGIRVCKEWKNDFMAFYKWAMEHGYKKGLSLCRNDIRKGYNPDNCRFDKVGSQGSNRRNNVMLTYKGKTQTLMAWARELKMHHQTLHQRIFSSGWSVAMAIETPVGATPKPRGHASGRKSR